MQLFPSPFGCTVSHAVISLSIGLYCFSCSYFPLHWAVLFLMQLFVLLSNRSLDICGCSNVSDNGICTLSKSCHRLELLDLTSTGVGHKRLVTSVLSLVDH